ncbi:hypothetical protein PORCRE_1551 [Porphyromonas crevioricanis JCM 15906]|uniref:Uncharacterized protein n=1 Tax=Porphyromonas crevioricanis JCM 15906 TaxID=1305617 RepID=T1CPS7_9PORP|nr:hypothetical protein PORCRE_1551 [Porphyromonas crevioricanis JCM 15906]GAD07579.1 hypothetical protein PORCAN_1201 [Porphyromonas crevioricanis JCM 13913]
MSLPSFLFLYALSKTYPPLRVFAMVSLEVVSKNKKPLTAQDTNLG